LIGLVSAVRDPPPRSEIIEGVVALVALTATASRLVSARTGAFGSKIGSKIGYGLPTFSSGRGHAPTTQGSRGKKIITPLNASSCQLSLRLKSFAGQGCVSWNSRLTRRRAQRK
jgi:hypothetical protein